MTAGLQAAAWHALAVEWAARWAVIFMVGATPWLIDKVLAKLRSARRLPHLARSGCALLAMLVCLYSLKLVPDTFRVESESENAFDSQVCRQAAPSTSLGRTGHSTLWMCEDGTAYLLPPRLTQHQTGGRVYWLRDSRLVVYLAPDV